MLVPESRDPAVPALDIRGLMVSTALLGVLVYTIIEAPARGWHSPETLFGFMAAAALALAFVTIEQAAEHPMLDVRLFTDRRFSAASASVTVTFFSLSGFIFLITQYFQVLRGFSPLATGARILPVALSIAVGSVAGGLFAPRIGTRAVVVSGLASFGTAMAWIADSIDTTTPYWTTIVAQMLLMGLGIGLVSTPATESIMLVLPPARAGIGSAVNDATRELGSTLGVAIVGSLFSSVFGAHLADSAFRGDRERQRGRRLGAGRVRDRHPQPRTPCRGATFIPRRPHIGLHSDRRVVLRRCCRGHRCATRSTISNTALGDDRCAE
jgi:MFS family permease